MYTLMLAGSLKCVTGLAGLPALAHPPVAGDAMALRVLADGAIRGAVLLAATAVVAGLLRRSSAATRHLVWCLGLTGALALVALPPLPPSWHVHVAVVPPELAQSIKGPVTSAPPSNQITGRSATDPPAALATHLTTPPTADAASVADASPVKPAAPPAGHVSRRSPWPLRLALLWLTGTLVAMARVLLGIAAAARLARRSDRVTDPVWTQLVRSLSQALGLRRRVTLYRGEPAAMPVTFGILRPALLLPEEAVPAAQETRLPGWSDERRRVVLLHELAHVKRRDCLTQLVARLACCVHWFNPLAWLAARRLHIERERACDDLVLTVGGHGPRPSDYAAHLLSIACTLRSRRAGAADAGVGVAMARASQLEGRLLAVLDARRDRRAPGRLATASAVASLLLLLLPLSLLRVTRADDREKPSPRGQEAPSKPRLPVQGTIPFVGDLPSGGRLELVAVSNHPSKGQAWWAPDGSPLRGRHKAGFVTFLTPFDTSGGKHGNVVTREWVLRLTDMPEGASYPKWRFSTGDFLSYYGGEAWPADDVANRPKGETRDWRAAATAVPADAEAVDIQVGVAAGEWRTVAENPAAEAGVRPVSGIAEGHGLPLLKDLPHLGPMFRTEGSGPGLEDVTRRVLELEKQLGVDEGSFSSHNGKEIQIDRLSQERSRVAGELAGLQARLAALVKELEAGRTPAEVEREIHHTSRYVVARQQVDEVDVSIERMARKFGPSHDKVIELKRLRETLQAKTDTIEEELKSNYAETMKNEMKNDLLAAEANQKRVDALLTKVKGDYERERKLLDEYRAMKALEAQMRRMRRGASFTKGFETDGNTVVSVAHGLTDHEVRVVAVGEDGQEVAAASNDTRTTDGVGHTTATFAKLSPKQIKSFRLQARPFEWVEFRGVALSPRAKGQAGKVGQRVDELIRQKPENLELKGPAFINDAPRPPGRSRTVDAGAGDVAMLRARHEQLLLLRKSLREAESQLAQAEEDLKQAEKDAAANKQPTVEDWARVDPAMEGQVRMRSEQLFRHASLEEQLGKRHPAVLRSAQDTERRDKFMKDYAAELTAKYVIRRKPDGTDGALIPRNLSGLRASVKRLRHVYEREAAELDDLRRATP